MIEWLNQVGVSPLPVVNVVPGLALLGLEPEVARGGHCQGASRTEPPLGQDVPGAGEVAVRVVLLGQVRVRYQHVGPQGQGVSLTLSSHKYLNFLVPDLSHG